MNAASAPGTAQGHLGVALSGTLAVGKPSADSCRSVVSKGQCRHHHWPQTLLPVGTDEPRGASLLCPCMEPARSHLATLLSPKERESLLRGPWVISPSVGSAHLHAHRWRHTDASCDPTRQTTPKSLDRELGRVHGALLAPRVVAASQAPCSGHRIPRPCTDAVSSGCWGSVPRWLT